MANTTDTRRSDRRQADADASRRDTPRLSGEPVKGRPANENDPGTAMLLAKMRRRPSFMPYAVVSVILIALWSFGWFYANSAALGGNAPAATVLQVLALLLVPVAVIWIGAFTLWRAADMRQVSEALFQSAMRLVRPQDIATEGLTTIAQAVRSEVDLLVGGVEHAVQRAAVLEEIVHKEIAAIERAFGGNEERIRNLVAGIENQRSALHQAALLISNDTNPLITRLENNTKNLDGIMIAAQDTLGRLEGGLRDVSGSIIRAVDDMTDRAAAAGNDMSMQTAHMEDVSTQMLGQLRDFSDQVGSQIDQMKMAYSNLNSETVDFGRTVQDMEANMTGLVRNAVDSLAAVHEDISRVIERSSITSSDQIRQQVAELAEVVQTTGSNLGFHLKTIAEDVTSSASASTPRSSSSRAARSSRRACSRWPPTTSTASRSRAPSSSTISTSRQPVCPPRSTKPPTRWPAASMRQARSSSPASTRPPPRSLRSWAR